MIKERLVSNFNRMNTQNTSVFRKYFTNSIKRSIQTLVAMGSLNCVGTGLLTAQDEYDAEEET